jgi:hypothetical protein
MTKKLTLPLALVVAAAFSASPAVAQKGHGNGHGNSGKHRPQVERRDRDRDRDDDSWRERQRREEQWQREQRVIQSRRSRTSSRSANTRLERRVPPGWCIGRGNPHNTVANCGSGSNRYDRRYDPRYNNTGTGSYGTYGGYNSGSYSDWKRWHDQQCRDLSRQRPLDLRWQLQVRQQCAAEDRQARAGYGV